MTQSASGKARGLKEVRPSPRPTPAELVAVARAHDPAMPPAVRHVQEGLVQLNVRVSRGLADQLADAAERQKISQRVLVCQALAAAGFAVDKADLTDRVVRRRRGSR